MKIPSNHPRGRFPVLTVALAAGAVLTLAVGAALAVTIKPGKYSGAESYQGFKSSTEFVTFTVNKSKTKVKKLRLVPFVANKCGSGGPPPKETSKTVKIKNGRFKGTVKELTTNGTVEAKGLVSGKFKAGGKVKGTVKSTLPSAPQCNATFTFTAKMS